MKNPFIELNNVFDKIKSVQKKFDEYVEAQRVIEHATTKARIEQEEKSKEMISQIQNGLRETEDIISKLKG